MTNKKLSPAKEALLTKWLQGDLKTNSGGIPRCSPGNAITLSFPQQRQLFLELLDRGTAVNNLSVMLDIKGRLDLGALEKSAGRIVARHDVLRTRFQLGMGLPTPEVLAVAEIPISTFDLRRFEVKEQLAEVRRMSEKSVLQPFNLTQAPLLRLSFYVLGGSHHLLLLTVHHTIADGWSLGVFLRELMMFYRSITGSVEEYLPELPIQYSDFAYWQTKTKQAESLPGSLNYWKKQLAGVLPVLELPADRPRTARQTFSGGTHRFVLSPELTKALEKLSREEGVTLFMTLLTGFYVLLYRYTGQKDILVGTPVANRNLPELEPLIGVFINTLVLRTSLSGRPGFRELLQRVRKVALEAYAHQDLPFEQLVEVLKPQRDLSRTPLFQVVFNLQNSPMPSLEIPGLKMDFLEVDRGVSQFEMTLMMTRTGEEYHALVEYNNDLFQEATIHRMFQSYLLLLQNAVNQPDRPISKLNILPVEAQDRMIYTLNQTDFEFPKEQYVHQLFEDQVERTPEAIAITCEETSLTYSELNHRANVLARKLQGLGAGPEVRVGILMERSAVIPEALLAVLKVGATYVPIHPRLPFARVQYILEDAGIRVLLTNIEAVSPDLAGSCIQVNNDWYTDEKDGSNLSIEIEPDHLAYIIYTSGSTGQPKGVMISHLAFLNFQCSMRERSGMEKGDVLLAVTSLSFDIAALELFLPLIVGGRVVIASEAMLVNPLLIMQAIQQYGVNIMQATPATWQLLLNSGWEGEPGLKALCGGDVMTRSMADQLLKRVDSLWNMYGPTETTIWSSVARIFPGNGPITIGQPVGNTQLYILDQELQPVPIGVIGELYIGGSGLARGYLNREKLTADRFVPDPFRSETGARLYRTGDLARYLADDSIELLGRMDDQVKINGHRIELGEVSAVLMQHPAVHEAIVLTRTEKTDEKRLVAYYVPVQEKDPETTELRDFLKTSLPNYMIPALFQQLDRLPLTPNGKVDRKALPTPESIRQSTGYVAPRNEAERMLTRIWQTALDVDQVGIHDNFFDLGGASIQSLEVVARANMYGFRIGIEHIFEYQTVAELAAYLARSH